MLPTRSSLDGTAASRCARIYRAMSRSTAWATRPAARSTVTARSFVDWNTDAYGFDSSTDPIYKSIPFFIGVGGAGGSYGLLLDNTWRTWFDFGHKTADTLAMGGPDGPIDYYIIAGPTTRDVVRRYTDLTGKAPLPPEWSLGYQQSRYSYMSADETRQHRRYAARRQDPDRRYLAGHRFPGSQPPVHGQQQGLPLDQGVWSTISPPRGSSW